MACCALKKQKKQFLVFSILLLIITSIIGGLVVTFLYIASIFSRNIVEKRNESVKFFKKLIGGLNNKILNEPFLFNSSVRCKISGKIMKLSNPVAGTVYKYFNLFIFVSIIFIFFFLFQGFKVILT